MTTVEDVMVIQTADVQPLLRGSLTPDAAPVMQLIERTHFFIDRPTAETSPQFRQIIPYVIVSCGDDVFVLQRTAKQTETRLHHKMSLGIGGHINPGHSVLEGLRKELEEEVSIADPYQLRFRAILNDESTEVGRVHLGVVYTLEASKREVTIRETEKMTGRWMARSELKPLRDSMETWSQIVLDQMLG